MSTEDLGALQAEVDRLRADNERLRGQLETSAPTARPGHWARSTAVVVLLALGFILTPLSVSAIWTRNQVLDTQTYVDTVAPLADDPVIIDTVANAITVSIFDRVDVQSLLAEQLPPRLSFAAGPLAGQIQSATDTVITKALTSAEFPVLWNQVNRTAHTAVVAFLLDKGPSNLNVQNNELVLDLAPILANVKQRLTDRGLTFVDKIPDINASVALPVANIDALVKARKAVQLLRLTAFVLPLLALGSFAGAIALSRRRRRTVIASGLLFAAGALVLGIALAMARTGFIDATTGPLFSSQAAAVVYDDMVRFLRQANRVVALVGLLVAIVAVVTGPSGWAVRLREMTADGIATGGRRTGLSSGRVGTFLAAHRRGYRITTIAAFGVLLVAWSRPTPAVVLWLFVLMAVVLAALEFVAAIAPSREPEPSPEPTGVP